MAAPVPLIKIVCFGLHLLSLTPFLICIILYFALVRDDGDVVSTTILKCTPIISLGFYVYFKGFKFTREYRYSQLILVGLIFSCLGDLFLNVDLFPVGMGAFAIAHIFYIIAFKFLPWRIYIGLGLYIFAAIMVVLALIFGTMETAIKVALPIYGFLLMTMVWRSIVRALVKQGVLAPLCSVGSVLFAVSDTVICVDMFIASFPNSRLVIMITYYMAQFLIAYSTLSDVLEERRLGGL